MIMTNLWITPDIIADSDTVTDIDIMSVEYASYVLSSLTGNRITGFSTDTDWYYSRPTNYNIAYRSIADIWGVSLDIHSIRVDYNSSDVINLRSLPALEIIAMADSDGNVIPNDSGVIYNKALLFRTDNKKWNFSKGVLVTYKHGSEVPEAAKLAAIELAKNIKYAITEDSSACQLSQRVQGGLLDSYQTQGVSYSFIDPQAFLSEGRTGITTVDLFIKATNPTGAVRPAKVYSTDIPRGYRKTR